MYLFIGSTIFISTDEYTGDTDEYRSRPIWLWLAPYIRRFSHVIDEYTWPIFVGDMDEATNIRGAWLTGMAQLYSSVNRWIYVEFGNQAFPSLSLFFAMPLQFIQNQSQCCICLRSPPSPPVAAAWSFEHRLSSRRLAVAAIQALEPLPLGTLQSTTVQAFESPLTGALQAATRHPTQATALSSPGAVPGHPAPHLADAHRPLFPRSTNSDDVIWIAYIWINCFDLNVRIIWML
jgi:hypothetical protein